MLGSMTYPRPLRRIFWVVLLEGNYRPLYGATVASVGWRRAARLVVHILDIELVLYIAGIDFYLS